MKRKLTQLINYILGRPSHIRIGRWDAYKI